MQYCTLLLVLDGVIIGYWLCGYLYHYGVSFPLVEGEFGPLSELFVDGFDDDQVWEEIQLTNEPFFDFLKQRVRKMASWKVCLCAPTPDDEAGDSDAVSENDICMRKTLGAGRDRRVVQFAEEVVEVDEEEAASDSEGSYIDDERESPPPHENNVATKRGRSAVDDKFFKLAEMQEFLGEQCLNVLTSMWWCVTHTTSTSSESTRMNQLTQ